MLAAVHVESYHTLCSHYIIGGPMFVCLFVCLSICLFVCLSVCLLICLSVCFSALMKILYFRHCAHWTLLYVDDCNSSQYVTTGGG